MRLPSKIPEPTEALGAILARAVQRLIVQLAWAVTQVRKTLKVMAPVPATLTLGSSLLRAGDLSHIQKEPKGRSIARPKAARVWLELGLALAATGETSKAIAALSRAVELNPEIPNAWHALAEQHALAGNESSAAAATAQQIRWATSDPALIEAASALCDNKLAVSERLLKDFLTANPAHAAAIRMLAEVTARLGRDGDAAVLYLRCLALEPESAIARHSYAIVLNRQNKAREAIKQIDILLRSEPRNPAFLALKGAALGRIGEYEQAIACYEDLLKAFPNKAKVWTIYGHCLRAVGRQRESIDAYKRSISLAPNFGEPYWSLANLKTFRFDAHNRETMQALLARSDVGDSDRAQLQFALGKSSEDEGHYAQAFEQYAASNALRRKSVTYDVNKMSEYVRRSKALLTAEFFFARGELGNPARDPIFIVGMPRAGSTLIEQILATHSAVEGTMELPDIVALARRLSSRKNTSESSGYPDVLLTLNSGTAKDLGAEYLERTRDQRKLGLPYFIDKMPSNFAHIGLIHLILPNARIIDARRHPLGCCFSVFKQQFARGQAFSYDLSELGRYYADYVQLMSHFDAVLPSRVHRVFYERMIEDTENEVRRLLDYCGLPFEEKCLKFFQNERSVRTLSSEQVRQPIFREGLEQWRHFEAWLGPLKDSLGEVLHNYPTGNSNPPAL